MREEICDIILFVDRQSLDFALFSSGKSYICCSALNLLFVEVKGKTKPKLPTKLK